jgi:hypothetical protein
MKHKPKSIVVAVLVGLITSTSTLAQEKGHGPEPGEPFSVPGLFIVDTGSASGTGSGLASTRGTQMPGASRSGNCSAGNALLTGSESIPLHCLGMLLQHRSAADGRGARVLQVETHWQRCQ